MDLPDNSFYRDRKWCPACDGYVPYLMSLDTSFCAECGGEVRLFSKEDWEAFSTQLQERRPRGGRRARRANKDAAAPKPAAAKPPQKAAPKAAPKRRRGA